MKRAAIVLVLLAVFAGCGRVTTDEANEACAEHGGVRAAGADFRQFVCMDGEAVEP